MYNKSLAEYGEFQLTAYQKIKKKIMCAQNSNEHPGSVPYLEAAFKLLAPLDGILGTLALTTFDQNQLNSKVYVIPDDRNASAIYLSEIKSRSRAEGYTFLEFTFKEKEHILCISNGGTPHFIDDENLIIECLSEEDKLQLILTGRVPNVSGNPPNRPEKLASEKQMKKSPSQ